ncbi:HU family DNA-binding protein [Candidatus Synechococcus calcipolaris G9]|uniref:HU family DNA-binding protein n=1 Tax=Candidatus Synechococcus calcipolaris G9 TaxID=1497997 RepID=A0ABT6F2R6_9SYNE|nr:HU family DNA-binding protein [Candidatus Synechococcus calcipolaris]MDG2992151.1 HU family DNA-binding protein [Candidatus Synechococcus calcipolaris G9]
MNKAELVDAVFGRAHNGHNVTKKQVEAVISATVEEIMDAVASGQKVTLVGFGAFEPRERKAREGRNPKTREKMQIPATTVPAFSAGKLFKEKVSPPAPPEPVAKKKK